MDYIDSGHSVRQCSTHFDYPQRTIRYWKARYKRFGTRSLEDRSHRPLNTRYTTYNSVIIDEIKRIRHKHVVGKVKLQILLRERGYDVGQSKIQKIINREGLKRTKRRKRYCRHNRTHIYTVPKEDLGCIGGLVYFDVKHLYVGGNKVYQFTAIDHSTRMLFTQIYPRITSRCGKDFFEYVQEELEYKIRYAGSDNGSEFLGEFEKLLSGLKTTHVFSSPRSPKQNPFVERVIKTIIEEHYQLHGLGVNIPEHKEQLDKYVHYYNFKRPHHSLNLLTPFQRYVKLTTEFRTT
jgi:transposase